MRRLQLVVEDRVHGVYVVVTGKGTQAGQHFVEHDGEGEDIASEINAAPKDLLRRHIFDRAHNRAGTGMNLNHGSFGAVGRDGTLALDEFGQAEVQNLGVAVAVDHQVFRLEV